MGNRYSVADAVAMANNHNLSHIGRCISICIFCRCRRCRLFADEENEIGLSADADVGSPLMLLDNISVESVAINA